MKVTTTQHMLERASKITKSPSGASESVLQAAKRINDSATMGVEIRDVELICSYLNSVAENSCRLHELLQGAVPYFPEKTKPQRNPELEKRLDALRTATENQAYASMVSDITRPARQQAEKDYFGTPSKQTSLGLNTLYTAAAVGAAGWLIARKFWSWPQWSSLVVGVAMGVAMLFVEMWLIVIRGSKAEKEARKPQQSSIVNRQYFDALSGKMKTVSEEIVIAEKKKKKPAVPEQEIKQR